MIRKDYILRFIEEIAKTIGIILGLLEEKKNKEAQLLYGQTIKKILNVEEEKVLDMSVDQLKMNFENKFGENYLGLETVANLIARGGDIQLKNGDESQAMQYYLKSLQLYNIIEMKSGLFSLLRQTEMGKVSQLIDQIKNNNTL
jgi:predicted negative regulator of RcsB-dependent stress response